MILGGLVGGAVGGGARHDLGGVVGGVAHHDLGGLGGGALGGGAHPDLGCLVGSAVGGAAHHDLGCLVGGAVGGVAHHDLGGVGTIDPDAHEQEVQEAGGDEVGLRDLAVVAAPQVGLHHRHAVHGERARLVRADGRGVAHGLAGVQVPY